MHVLGAGRAGCSLAAVLADRGVPIGALVCRHEESAEEAARAIGAGRPTTQESEALEAGAITLLGVPDREVLLLTERLRTGSPVPGGVVLHLAGALSAEVLAPLRERGLAVGGMHPAHAFAGRSAVRARFEQTAFAVDGDELARRRAEELVALLGGRVLRLAPGGRPLHHAASAVVSNFVVTLFDRALSLEESAGVEASAAREALLGLLRSTVRNLEAELPVDALTGPIERGDAIAVRAHLRALAEAGATADGPLYRSLALATLDLAIRKGLPAASAQALRRALDERPDASTDGGVL